MKENNSNIDKLEPLDVETNEPVVAETNETTDAETSDPIDAEASEPVVAETSEPIAAETSEPAAAETSEPVAAETSEPVAAETGEPTDAKASEPIAAEASEPVAAETSEPAIAETSEPVAIETNEPVSAEASDIKVTETGEAKITEIDEGEAKGVEANISEDEAKSDEVQGDEGETKSVEANISEDEAKGDKVHGDEGETTCVERKKLSTKHKAMIGGGLAIVVLIAVLIGLVVSGAFLSPAQRFQRIQRAAIFNPIVESVRSDNYHISTDVSISLGLQNPPMDMTLIFLQSILENSSLDISMNVDSSRAVYRYGLNISNSDLISMTYVVDSVDQYFGFYIPELDSNYYTMDWGTFFSLQGIDRLLEENGSYVFSPEAMAKLIESQADIILSMVNDNNIEEYRGTIALFDESREVRATVYTFVPSQEDIYHMLLALVEEIRDNELYFIYFAMIEGDNYRREGYESVRHYFDSMLSSFQSDLSAVATEIADSGFTWRTATRGRQLLMQELSFTTQTGAEFMLRYEGHGQRGERTDWLTVEGAFSSFFFTNDFVISLQNDMTLSRSGIDGMATLYFQNYTSINEDAVVLLDINDLLYQFETILDNFPGFMGDVEKRELLIIDYDFDLRNQSILGVPYGTMDAAIFHTDGTALFDFSIDIKEHDYGGTDHILTIPSIAVLNNMGFTVTIHSTDEPSDIEAPDHNPVDLSGYSAEEIELIISEMMEQLQGLFMNLLMGGLF